MGSVQNHPSGLSLLNKPRLRFASGVHRPGAAFALSVVVGLLATMNAVAADLTQAYPSRLVRIFSKFVADESEKWAKVIRAGNIKAE
jgi:hypothetical protein